MNIFIYFKKFLKDAGDGKAIESIVKGIKFFISPYFTWLKIKIKGQDKYKISDLNKGLELRPQKHLSDSDILKIIESYLGEKKGQEQQPEAYKIGGLWEEFLMQAHQELRAQLENKDIAKVRAILSDFGRNKISLGLGLFGSLPNNFLSKIRLVNLMNMSYFAWKKMTKLSDDILEYPRDVGNFFGFEKNGKFVIDIAPRLSYHAKEISNLLCDEQHPVVVEIGPGLGGIPYNLFKYFDLKCTYIIFEIPEVAVVTKYFLKSVFPDKKFLFYNESKIQNINLKDYDIIFMPHYELKNLPNKCSDLVFNSSSLTEMSHSTVKEYMLQINRICKKYFMHINEESSFEYKAPTGEIRTTVDLNNPQFKLPEKDFKRIYRFPALLGVPGCEYGDYFYYEYLYERKNY